MNQQSAKILENFARKMANCRHNVTVQSLVEHLGRGKFGYSYLKDGSGVELNEFVYAEDVMLVITQIRNIIKEPHIFLKREGIIQNASVATNIDTEALLETYTDYKLWKVKDNAFEPEYVHSFVNEDNLAIYENCFITHLIDLLLRHCVENITRLMNSVKTINELSGIGKLPKGAVTEKYFSFFDSNNGEPPVLADCEGPDVVTLNTFIKCQKILQSLTHTEFYKACKKNKRFVLMALKPTNILLMDKRYNYCYLFYNNIIRNNRAKKIDQAYVSFVTINFFELLLENGFTLASEDEIVKVSRSGALNIENLAFTKEPFTVTLNKETDSRVLNFDVRLNPENTVAKYTIEVLENIAYEEIPNCPDVNLYAYHLDKVKKEEVSAAFLITDVAPVETRNAAYVIPNKADTSDKLKRFLTLMMLQVQASVSVHSRKCPVCGGAYIAYEENDFICSSCDSKYHLYHYGVKEYAWIKEMPIKVGERKAIYNDIDDFEPVCPHEVEGLDEEDYEIFDPNAYLNATNKDEEIDAECLETCPFGEDYVGIAPDFDEEEEEEQGKTTVKIERSFQGKLLQSEANIKTYFDAIRNYMLCRNDVTESNDWAFNDYLNGDKVFARFAFKDGTLLLLLSANPDEVRSKYSVNNLGVSKKYEDLQTVIVIKSENGVMLAKNVINDILADKGAKVGYMPTKINPERVGDEILLQMGLARYVEVAEEE